jgi:ABC-2 type transport system permease protein
VLFASVAYGLVITLSVGTLMLALSSLTARSLYVGIAWAGLWLISGSVSSIMTEIHRDNLRRQNAPPEALRSDWRPLCSYETNLQRLGDELLDADGAWTAIGKAFEKSRTALGAAFPPGGGFGKRTARPPGQAQAEQRPAERQLAEKMVLQSPWQWSAGILAGLMGVSVWVMLRRVKSLDRLR